MFGRKKVEPRQTVILEGTEVLGTIRANGNVLIEGILDGDLSSEGGVSIGANGLVRGHVIGGSVSIAGRVEGTVLAHGRLTMQSGGRLVGDAQYGTLEVHRGGVIEGRSMPLGPTSAIPPALPVLVATPMPALPATIAERGEPTPSAGVPLEVQSADEAPPSRPSVPPPGPNGNYRRTVMRMPPPPPASNNGTAAAAGNGAA
ncbi:MAG: polymer-forming cytoskeletal protein [Deltaproteobacteria bacterium]|nr:polymer-forming cytoskeletal protein [Deltaproteobacteria bacterium]